MTPAPIRGKGRIIFKLSLIIVAIIAVAYILKPNREEKALRFVGGGKIIESSTQVRGFSSTYWARIECNHDTVRRHIQMRNLPLHAPDLRTIQKRFSPGFIDWPKTIGEFSKDWKEFEIGGKCHIVVFNDKNLNEVLYVTWSY